MKKDELIKMLEKVKAPCLPGKEVLWCERRFIDNNFPKLVQMQRQRRKRKFAFALVSIAIVFFIIFGSAALNGYVKGAPPFLSVFGKYIYFAKMNDTVVARVNGVPIYLSNVANEYFLKKASYEFHEKYYGEQFVGTPPDPVDILNDMINKALFAQYMRRKGYELDIIFIPQKEWFDYEVQGDIPQGIHLDPIAHKYFKEKSKIIRDAVSHSNLTEDEFFDKIIVPQLKTDEYTRALKEDIEDSITVPDVTEEEINHYIATRGKGLITFAEVTFPSKEEADKAFALFEAKYNPCYVMLDEITQKTSQGALTNLTFTDFNDFSGYLKKAFQKNKELPYLSEVKDNDEYHLVCIFNYEAPRAISRGEAAFLVKQSKKKVEAEKVISKLELKLAKEARIEIINKKAVEDLANMH